MSATQDPTIKGNPWLVRYDRLEDCYLVPSASGPGDYAVSLVALDAGADYPEICTCPCRKRCWHIDAALLHLRLAEAADNARRGYAGRSLASLQAEDRRLARLLAHAQAGDHFLRAQYDALGTVIGETLAHQAQVA